MTQQDTQPPAETLAEAQEIAIHFALPGMYDGISTHATRRGDADDKPYMRAILAALTRRAGGDAIPEGEMEIRAITTQMRRLMPNACGDWADKIDAALAANEVRKVAFYDEPGADIRPGETLADRDRRIYQQGRHDALNDEPEQFI